MSEQFRQVAEVPLRPPITRTSRNPIDKSTIVSIYPKEIIEYKVTIEPGKFVIPPGRMDNPGVLVVGTSSWWSYSGDSRPTIEVPISSVQIADAVIKDFSNGMLACDMVDARPGLFFVPGDITTLELKAKYKDAFKQAEAKQRVWYTNLVLIADSLWARANGNPLAISDEMRLAARELNLNNKPWLLDYQTIQMINCFACGTMKSPLYPICPNCKSIDPSYQGPEIKRAV